MSLTDDTSRIAGRFLAARRAAAGLESYPGDFPATLDDAYAIQDEAIASWGRPVIGWKSAMSKRNGQRYPSQPTTSKG